RLVAVSCDADAVAVAVLADRVAKDFRASEEGSVEDDAAGTVALDAVGAPPPARTHLGGRRCIERRARVVADRVTLERVPAGSGGADVDAVLGVPGDEALGDAPVAPAVATALDVAVDVDAGVVVVEEVAGA